PCTLLQPVYAVIGDAFVATSQRKHHVGSILVSSRELVCRVQDFEAPGAVGELTVAIAERLAQVVDVAIFGAHAHFRKRTLYAKHPAAQDEFPGSLSTLVELTQGLRIGLAACLVFAR